MTVNGISGANNGMQAGSSGRITQMDSVSKNIQNQIANAQKKLQELSSNEELSIEDKMKKRPCSPYFSSSNWLVVLNFANFFSSNCIITLNLLNTETRISYKSVPSVSWQMSIKWQEKNITFS